MREIGQDAETQVMLFLADAADHMTGKTGLALSVELSKNGGPFEPAAPTVVERGYGWYSVGLSPADTVTPGDLVVRATAQGADPGERITFVTPPDENLAALTMLVAGMFLGVLNTPVLGIRLGSEEQGYLTDGADAPTPFSLTVTCQRIAAQGGEIVFTEVAQATLTNGQEGAESYATANIPDGYCHSLKLEVEFPGEPPLQPIQQPFLHLYTDQGRQSITVPWSATPYTAYVSIDGSLRGPENVGQFLLSKDTLARESIARTLDAMRRDFRLEALPGFMKRCDNRGLFYAYGWKEGSTTFSFTGNTGEGRITLRARKHLFIPWTLEEMALDNVWHEMGAIEGGSFVPSEGWANEGRDYYGILELKIENGEGFTPGVLTVAHADAPPFRFHIPYPSQIVNDGGWCVVDLYSGKLLANEPNHFAPVEGAPYLNVKTGGSPLLIGG